MKQIQKQILSLLLAASLACSGVLPALATEAEETIETTENTVLAEPMEAPEPYTYTIDGIGEILSATASPLGTSGTLYQYTAKNGSLLQSVFAAEIDPARGGIVRGVPLTDRFGGRAVLTALAAKETAEGETLLLATNADFFSTTTGVPMGVYVADGRFASSSDGRAALGFDAEGNAFIGMVEDTVELRRGEESFPISYLNKYPTVYGAYLLTRDYGETTYLAASVPSTEYIFALESDVVFGTPVQGELVEIRSGVANGSIPENCAVLVVPDVYAYRSVYATLAVGDRILVEANASEQFTAAVNAVGGGDILLIDGKIAENLNTDSLQTARHPRTAVGIKETGEILLVAVDGRQNGYANGLRLTELAAMLADMGCVSAINFDGGGSTAMVRYDTAKATVVNKPSDKTQRKVPNAIAAYADAEIADNLHIFTASAAHPLMLSGSTQTLTLTLRNAQGEAVDFLPDADRIAVTVDERFGRVRIAGGKVEFTAAEVDGCGHIRLETAYEEEVLTADLYLRVTSSLDSFAADQTLLLAPTDGEILLRVQAEKDGQTVYFGDLLDLYCENPRFEATIEGAEIRITFADSDADAPVPRHGMILLGMDGHISAVSAFFTDALDLTEMLAGDLRVSDPAYTVSYDAAAGVLGEGAFRIEPPVETTAEPVETTAEPVETTAEPAETTAEPVETTAEPVETTAEPAEIAEPEPITVALQSSAVISRGISGRRLWAWVDGLAADAAPYAVFAVTDAEGRGKEVTVPYTLHHDFLDFNGRALLTLTVPASAGAVTIVSPLVYTAQEPLGTVTFGRVLLAEAYDTNRYADTAAHWSSDYVNALSYMGIVQGSTDADGNTVYRPDDGLSREQFAKILVNYLRIDPDIYADVVPEFVDAAEIAAWAMPYVKAAVGAGLMRGRGTAEGTLAFAPADGITRQEAFYVLGGLLETAEGEEMHFADSDRIAPWAAENLSKILAAGLLSGYDDGTIRPEGRITRAEAATIVVRLFDFMRGIG